jgi:DNA-binding XRE family transcriptional regulator
MDRSRKAFDELTAEERRADFKKKNAVLQQHYQSIPAILFYSDFLFHDMNEEEFKPSIILYNNSTEEGEHQWKRKAVALDDLVDYFNRDDVAINPCGYWNNYPKSRLMRRIYAFVMDVDEVRPDTMQHLIDHIEQGRFPRPTAITNSGSGVHFFFMLDVAMHVGYHEKYLQNLRFAQQIYDRLHRKLTDLYPSVQQHHLGQDYRVVGSITKFGDITTAWESGQFWDVEELAKALGLDSSEFYQPMTVASGAMQAYAKSIAKSLDLPVPDMNDARSVYDFIAEHKDAAYEVRTAERERTGKKKKKLRGWYETTWNRVYTKTEAGNRFNAMKGLAIVAYKAGISEERFEHDLYKLSTLWQERIWKGADPFNADNVEAIMRMFRNGERYRKTKRKTLEGYFGWKWDKERKDKAPLPQEEHLELARLRKKQKKRAGTMKGPEGRPKGVGTAQAKVQQYRAENPEATVTEVARALEISRTTVYKWWNGEPVAEKKKTATPSKMTEPPEKAEHFDWKSHLAKTWGVPMEEILKFVKDYEEGKFASDDTEEEEE